MITEPQFFRPQRRLPGLAATLAVHLMLLLCWQLARQQPDALGPARRIQWINVQPAKPARPPEAARAPEKAQRAQARAMARPEASRTPAVPAPTQAVAPPAPSAEPAAELTPHKSAYDILAQARKDLGAINKDLGKEFPGPKISAPIDNAQARLARGIEHAAEMAPPKWYEQAKIKELVEPGGYGRRRYRIITARGTYCITYESNHAPDGIDVIAKGMQKKTTTCPKDEQPPTTQKGL